MSAFLNSIVKALQKVADWRVISIFLFRFKRNMAAVVMHMGWLEMGRTQLSRITEFRVILGLIDNILFSCLKKCFIIDYFEIVQIVRMWLSSLTSQFLIRIKFLMACNEI